MMTRLKAWWNKLRGKEPKFGDTSMQLYHTTPGPVIMTGPPPTSILEVTNADGETIFEIDPEGKAIWHKEDTYDEAASIFLTYLTMQVEDAVGIQQSRIDWEKEITRKLVAIAEENGGSIDANQLTEVINKCIMYDKLKGKYGEN